MKYMKLVFLNSIFDDSAVRPSRDVCGDATATADCCDAETAKNYECTNVRLTPLTHPAVSTTLLFSTDGSRTTAPPPTPSPPPAPPAPPKSPPQPPLAAMHIIINKCKNWGSNYEKCHSAEKRRDPTNGPGHHHEVLLEREGQHVRGLLVLRPRESDEHR